HLVQAGPRDGWRSHGAVGRGGRVSPGGPAASESGRRSHWPGRAVSSKRNAIPSVDLDALLCALTLVPTAFARNRFFNLFENPAALKVRRRASRVRGIK